MHGALLAAVTPDNTPHGYNLTFAFPMLLFIVVAGALYLRFRAPHRVPGHVARAKAQPAKAEPERAEPERAEPARAEAAREQTEEGA